MQFNSEDMIRAHQYAIETLAALLVVSGKIPPAQMAGFIEITSAKMEKHGHIKASAYLRHIWAGGLDGEWEKAARSAGNIA